MATALHWWKNVHHRSRSGLASILCQAGLDFRQKALSSYHRQNMPKGAIFLSPSQISGNGRNDIVFAPGFISHLEHMWEDPRHARFFHGLETFSRLIRFDKRGTGLSDRSVGFPTLDERIDDIRAVMDAAGSKRAVLLGVSEGGAMIQLFAASKRTCPDRLLRKCKSVNPFLLRFQTR